MNVELCIVTRVIINVWFSNMLNLVHCDSCLLLDFKKVQCEHLVCCWSSTADIIAALSDVFTCFPVKQHTRFHYVWSIKW